MVDDTDWRVSPAQGGSLRDFKVTLRQGNNRPLVPACHVLPHPERCVVHQRAELGSGLLQTPFTEAMRIPDYQRSSRAICQARLQMISP